MRRETAERILAVPVDDSSRAPNSHVDSTGCPLRCTFCGQWGFWRKWRHRSPANLRRSMTSDTVTARTTQLVDEMYERLWDAPPPQHTTAQRKASAAARVVAARQGWLPPLAWDDIDDAPEPDQNQPDTSGSEDDLDEIAIERASPETPASLTYAEQIEVAPMSNADVPSAPSLTCCH